MKKLFFFIVITNFLYAQSGYVQYDHPVLNFLERMQSQAVISGYDSFEIPKTRNQIAEWLKIIYGSLSELSHVEKEMLEDYMKEFEFEISFSTGSQTQLFQDISFEKFIVQKEKYLYYYTDSSNFNLFANGILSVGYAHENHITKKNALIVNYGGSIRGTFLHNFGYYIKATNGTFAGSRSLVQTLGEIRYNYKFNYDKVEEGGVDYFDETEGYLMYEDSFMNAKIGRDRINIGYGPVKTIISDNAPKFDHIGLNVNYKIFSFSFLHGKLLGEADQYVDSLQGLIRSIDEKYIAYHRFGFNFSKHIVLGIGEMVIYSRRSFDISYLNPFNYFKSIEHANQDRDNSILFFDAKNNSIKNLSLYSTLMIDDIDFSKIGTSWYGNRFLLNLAVQYSNGISGIPISLQAQYIHIDPYFYTHRITGNNYTNQGFNIGSYLQPNSRTILGALNIYPHYRLNFEISFSHTEHGANKYDGEGKLIENFGGDLEYGYLITDNQNAVFLDGIRNITNTLSFKAVYEPIKNYAVNFYIQYVSGSAQDSDTEDKIFSSLTVSFNL